MKIAAALVLAVAAGALLGAGWRAQDPYEQMDAFREKAHAERQKLGLDRATAKARFPTPEVSLVGRSEPLQARPGETVEIRTTGKVARGSLVVFGACPELEIVSVKQSTDGVHARVKVPATHLPATCDLIVVAPVSGIQRSLPVLEVRGDFKWSLKLANGMALEALTRADAPEGFAGDGAWSLNGKPLTTRTIVFSGSGDTWEASVQLSQEEAEARAERTEAALAKADTDAVMKKMQVLTEKMQKECTPLPPERMTPCFEKYQKQIEAVTAPLGALQDELESEAGVHPNACTELKLQVRKGRVTGTGEGCRAAEPVAVTGTVTPVK